MSDIKDELLKHYVYLNRLAGSKLSTQSDADDLVAETYLAAFAYLKCGGVIEYPKTWLANTLMHKLSSHLRKKYRMTFVSIGTLGDSVLAEDDFEYSILKSEEANELRRELLMLSQMYREVLIRHYFYGEEVAQIAKELDIPVGTVKRRLFDGRQRIRKGLEKMNPQENMLPQRLNVAITGYYEKDPLAAIECDLLVQSILCEAYEKPLKPTEIARRLGVPAPYIENELDRLVRDEIMVKTTDGRYYSDFIIRSSEFNYQAAVWQNEFARRNFDTFWHSMSGLIEDVANTDIAKKLNQRQLKKLQRWAVMRLLQEFREDLLRQEDNFACPARRDGGRWIMMGWVQQSISVKERNAGKYPASAYAFSGLRNDTGDSQDRKNVLSTHEFDTSLWDDPHRWASVGDYNSLRNLLWGLNNGIPIEESGVRTQFLEKIERLITIGVLAREDGRVVPDIPILSDNEYNVILNLITPWKELLKEKLGAELGDYLNNCLEPIPPHLKSVPDWLRSPSDCTTISAVYEAYDRGLWLNDVDYCCPPMVMTYE